MQVALFWQGSVAHSSMSVSQLTPMNAIQRIRLVASRQLRRNARGEQNHETFLYHLLLLWMMMSET